jgi:AraC family transcriptional regulator, regulatory protein of adaptative response / methylated-DNA-[protein]-cysteine methyltransferase
MHNQQKWWDAVLHRDENFDGRFVYAVRSTGVYCRPTCPSRRPNRSQVIFFPARNEAEQAGFRPCHRCKPQESIRASTNLIQRACTYIQDNHTEPLKLADLSRHLQISPSHLQRLFKRALGISPAQYAEACRMRTVKANLQSGKDVTTAIYESGFGSSSRLYERAQTSLGMTPATYGKGGQGIRIGYAIAACPLGRLLIAATPRGLCAVILGNSDRELKAALEREYPKADLYEDHQTLNKTINEVLKYLEGHQPRLDFPLDIRATAFQCRVWEELRRIPYGTTRSYSDIAKMLGRPKAVRAVARACATNPVALVIPCHRVVARTGDLTGYRWGKERKAALLAQEQKRRHK